MMSVFANAALPQKVVLLALIGAILAILAATVQALRRGPDGGPWRRLISCLGPTGLAVGLLVGAMNGFHMARTIQRVPFEPTAKQLAPGILEVSALVGFGALVGLAALIANLVLGLTSAAPGRNP